MRYLKYYILSSFFLIFLVGCEKEEVGHVFSYKSGDATITVQEVNGEPLYFIKGDVTTDFTMTSNRKWVLDGPLKIMEGGVLTINPGVTIYANVSYETSYISVEDKGVLKAIGTKTEPITITSLNEFAGVPQGQDWAGIFIYGKYVKDSSDSNYKDDPSGFVNYIEEYATGEIQNVELRFAEKTIVK